MNIEPLHDRVLLKKSKVEETSAGGIVIPTAEYANPDRATVVAVGEGVLLDNGKVRALSVKPGDDVLLAKYAGNAVEVDGRELIMVRENEILAIIK